MAEPESQPEYVALEPVREPTPVGPAGGAARRRTRRRGLRRRRAARARGRRRRRGRSRARTRAKAGRWRGATPTAASAPTVPARRHRASCCRRARRSASSRTRSTPPASPTGPRRRRSCTAPARSATCSWCSRPSTTPPTSSRWSSALRSPIFGCGDDDLYTFKVEHGGRWDHQPPLPESLPARPSRRRRACARSPSWHDARLLVVAERAARPHRARAAGARGRVRTRAAARPVAAPAVRGRPGARVRGGRGRQRCATSSRWAELQGSEGARVVETVLPETDDDAVRILTIHGAKGLEFPITILSGMTTKAAGRRAGVQLLFPHDRDTYAVRVSTTGHHRGVRAATHPSTSRWTSTRSCASSTSP